MEPKFTRSLAPSAVDGAIPTAAAPIYPEGQLSAVSMDLAGDLRTVDVNSNAIRVAVNELAWAAALQAESIFEEVTFA